MLPIPTRRARGVLAGIFVLAVLCIGTLPAHAISGRMLFSPTGAASGDYFGYSVAPAGDFDADGRPDVIVGAPHNDAGGGDAGRAYLYSGANLGAAPLLFTGVAGEQLGFSVASAGDFNGDGYDDVIVGCPTNAAGNGRALIFYGGPAPNTSSDLTLPAQVVGENFGISVAGAGDVNGDGYADVIVGAPFNSTGGVDIGRAYVFYGGAVPNAIPDITLTGLVAGDELGWSVASTGDFNADGYADVIVGARYNDAAALDAGAAYVYYGGPVSNNAADVILLGSVASDHFGTSVASAGDINGDGNPDVIVGAPDNDATAVNAGAAYVFFGGPAASSTADLTLLGADASDAFGTSVSSAGDVNGDGFADMIVGADLAGATSNTDGLAYIFLGGSSPNAVADLVMGPSPLGDTFGISVAGAGDVDGDGYGDVLVGDSGDDSAANDAGRFTLTAVYPYQVISPNGGEQWVAGGNVTVRWRGHDAADLALSTDGGATYATLFNSLGGAEENQFTLTCPDLPTEAAKVRLSFRGQTVTRATSDVSDGVFRIVSSAPAGAVAMRLHRTHTGEAVFDQFGFSVAPAGDMNGDGLADYIVGAPTYDTGVSNSGRAYVFLSGNPGTTLTLTGTAGEEFGYLVAGAGDVNGDGFDDVIVGARFNDLGGVDIGRAYLYLGSASPDATADLEIPGATGGDEFGHSVAGAGDVNGDGYADMIVGAPFNDFAFANAGRAYLFLGGTTLDATADAIYTGVAASDQLGFSVARAGDVNGDGFSDLVVGVPGNDAGGGGAGAAYVFFGGASPDAVPDMVVMGELASDQLGYSVAGAGDVNGDGLGDVMIGAPFNNAGGSDAGRTYVVFGTQFPDSLPTPDVTLTGAAAGEEFGFSVARAGDLNGDGFDDVVVGALASTEGGTNAGRAYAFFGGPPPDATPDLVLTGAAIFDILGFAVATPGDVNHDGFDDLLAGAPAVGVGNGRAFLYDVNRYHVVEPAGGATWNVGATQTVSWLGAEPADLWLSVNGGGTWELVRSGVGGSASNGLALQVPHQPTRFAKLMLTPTNTELRGSDVSDSMFTIQTSVSLLSLAARVLESGVEIAWSTDPGVGPAGLAGYRLYRLAAGATGNGTRVGPELIVEPRYLDAGGAPGMTYRLTAVNGLQEELELGRVAVTPAINGLSVWPSPLAARTALHVVFVAPLVAPGVTATDLDVGLFDVHGRRIATLARGYVAPAGGAIALTWDAREAGASVPAGLYFVRALAPSARFRAERKLVIVP